MFQKLKEIKIPEVHATKKDLALGACVALTVISSVACSSSAAIPSDAGAPKISVDMAAGVARPDFEALTKGISSPGRLIFDQLKEAADAAWLRGEGGENIYADTRTLDKFPSNDAPLPLRDLVKSSKLPSDHFLAVRVPEADIPLGGQGSDTSFSNDWFVALPESRDPAVAARMAADLRALTVDDVVKNPAALVGILRKLGPNGSGVIVRNTLMASPAQPGFDDSVLRQFSLDVVYETYARQTGVQRAFASSPDPTGMISTGEVVALIRNGNRFPWLQRIPPGGQTLHFLANSPEQLAALSGGELTQMLAQAAAEAAVPVTYTKVGVMVVPASQDLVDLGVIRTTSGELKIFVLRPQYRLLKVGRTGLDYTTRLEYQTGEISQAVATSKPLAQKIDAFSPFEGMSLPEVESGIAARIMLKAKGLMSGGVVAGANAVLIFAPAISEGVKAQKVQDQVIPALVNRGQLKPEDVESLDIVEALAFAKSYVTPDTTYCKQTDVGRISYPLKEINSSQGVRLKPLKEIDFPDSTKTFRFCEDLPFTIARGDLNSVLVFHFDDQVLNAGPIKIIAKGQNSEQIIITKTNPKFSIKSFEIKHGTMVIELPDKRMITVSTDENDLFFELQVKEEKT